MRHLLIDVLGRAVRTNEIRTPTAGLSLQLTLDMKLQTVAEKLAELRTLNGETCAGAVVVLEARTGRVKAPASLPQFDPRPFARGINETRPEPDQSNSLRCEVLRRAPILELEGTRSGQNPAENPTSLPTAAHEWTPPVASKTHR
ncbi:MAG: hypothetical protein HY319_18190 [Armatimonadetes bacterium]|nr:hypothetical protein [Armatimonadota bacterium]